MLQNGKQYIDVYYVRACYAIALTVVFRSTHGGPDWTCVIVGFSSGYVRMYTEV